MEPIQGIWFEKGRNRWRVKLSTNGQVYHRSYHHDYDDAFITWTRVKRELMLPRPEISEFEALSLIARFLRQPLPGAGRRVTS